MLSYFEDRRHTLVKPIIHFEIYDLAFHKDRAVQPVLDEVCRTKVMQDGSLTLGFE